MNLISPVGSPSVSSTSAAHLELQMFVSISSYSPDFFVASPFFSMGVTDVDGLVVIQCRARARAGFESWSRTIVPRQEDIRIRLSLVGYPRGKYRRTSLHHVTWVVAKSRAMLKPPEQTEVIVIA